MHSPDTRQSERYTKTEHSHLPSTARKIGESGQNHFASPTDKKSWSYWFYPNTSVHRSDSSESNHHFAWQILSAMNKAFFALLVFLAVAGFYQNPQVIGWLCVVSGSVAHTEFFRVAVHVYDFLGKHNTNEWGKLRSLHVGTPICLVMPGSKRGMERSFLEAECTPRQRLRAYESVYRSDWLCCAIWSSPANQCDARKHHSRGPIWKCFILDTTTTYYAGNVFGD